MVWSPLSNLLLYGKTADMAAAKSAGVEVRLKDVQTDLGWEIFLFPFYKGYKCTGEVIGPDRARS